MTDDHLADLRRSYAARSLAETDVHANAMLQLRAWLDEALSSQVEEPTAMCLATVDAASGQPSARIVLLKGLPDDEGLLFFTNYDSHKGHELAAQPRAAITFFWPALERQVRVEGVVTRAAETVSTAYFQSRPRGSQIGAWASPQSQPVADRAELEAREHDVAARFAGQDPLPRPPHWGGYVLRPQRIEFWQGRPSRLHDRLQYERQADDSWRISRLAP